MMEEEEKAILLREEQYICREVAESSCFGGIVYDLKMEQAIEEEVAKEILTSNDLLMTKMRRVLRVLIRGQSGTFRTFLDILIRRGLNHVVSRLDPRAFEQYGQLFGGPMDKLDAERMPDIHGVGEPNCFRNLPALPRRSSSSASLPETDTNGNGNYNHDMEAPLRINVRPAREYGGSHIEPSELYPNKTKPRGLVFLANYKTFTDSALKVRDGSEIDVKNLSLLFNQMGYKVPEVHMNLNKYHTLKALREFRNLEDHKHVDSCIVVIMSHGRDHKSFYTSDSEVLGINDVVERFSNTECDALRGKPKIFIFQYCRGSIEDIGTSIEPVVFQDGGLKVATDASFTSVVDRDPTFSDMYIVYSTLEGYVSFRHPDRGSWLMEAICNVFMNDSCTEELDTLMKRVSRQVRRNITDHGNKQVCEFVQRGFDKHFYFNPSPLNTT